MQFKESDDERLYQYHRALHAEAAKRRQIKTYIRDSRDSSFSTGDELPRALPDGLAQYLPFPRSFPSAPSACVRLGRIMLVGQQVQFVLSAERGCCTMPIRRSVVPLQFREQMQRISFPHFAHLASVIYRQDRDAVRAAVQRA